MGKRKVGALEKLDADLVSLQNKIRRDPLSYKDDFERQYQQYAMHREIFLAGPAIAGATSTPAADAGLTSFRELIDLIAHVADCYPETTRAFPGDLMDILTTYHVHMDQELREKMVLSLVLLRRKQVLDSSTLLQAFFPILTTTVSKNLRLLLFQKILSDIRSSNAKTTDHRLNRTIQTVLYNLVLADRSSVQALWAVKFVRELWKRQIWTDARTVDIIKEACLADHPKVVVAAVRFFLGGDQEREEHAEQGQDSDEADDAVDVGRLKHQMGIQKKKRKNEKIMSRAVATVKRAERRRRQPHPLNFSAFHLLHDPQSFADALFNKHLQGAKTSKLNLEQRIQVLQLVTRLVGLHKLTNLALYSYFIKFLSPRQPSVTAFLASLAQATHALVPPESLEPLVVKIANEFVSEAAASEVASAGLNAIREICSRQPLAMNETLLQDLVQYRKSKDKGVMVAAKGLLSFYRQANPKMLSKRDRGKDATMSLREGSQSSRRYGETTPGTIEGLELLQKWKEDQINGEATDRRGSPPPLVTKQQNGNEGSIDHHEEDGIQPNDDDDDDDDAWEVDEDSDDSGGWINVVSSDEDDHGGMAPPRKRRKASKSPTEGNDSSEESEHLIESTEPPEGSLATTRILTPADLAKLRELRLEASLKQAMPTSQRKRLTQANLLTTRHSDDPLTATEIEGLARLSKRTTKEDKIAQAKEGKTDKHERKGKEARRQERKREQGKSSTNREKARRKNIMMTMGKAKGKQKRSLVEKGKILKMHTERAKRGGKRGNR